MENELLEIDGITLLSAEEAKALPESIINCDEDWWLRSPSYNYDRAAVATYNGLISSYHGASINLGIIMARPALIIPELEDLGLEKFKDSIEVFDREWIYIGNGMVLAEEPIFQARFDVDSNDYETSEIKQRLESWLKNQMEKY